MDAQTTRVRAEKRRPNRRATEGAFEPSGTGGQRRKVRGVPPARIEAVLAAAENAGLLSASDSRIAGRVSASLIERAKARTGLRSDTELLVFAIASVALEDDFAETFEKLRGTVDPRLDLEF
jgi:hypothetical protein